MSDKFSGQMSSKIHDNYGRIYSTTTRLLLDLMQGELQAYHYHLEVEERTDAADTTNTVATETEITLEELPSVDPTSSTSDVPSQNPTIFPSPIPYDLQFEEPIPAPPYAPSHFSPSGDPSNLSYPLPYDLLL